MSQLKLDNIKLNSTSTGLVINSNVTATKFFGDGSGLSGISGFPFTGSANISGSLNVTSAVTASVLTGLTVADDSFSKLVTLNGGYKISSSNSNFYKFINNVAIQPDESTLTTIFGTGVNNYIYALDKQSDGKIIIGGFFTSYSGSSINRIARINTDGTLDTTFNVGTGANVEVHTTTLQPDGKIIIGGSFTSYSGSSINRLARLNTDGTLDTTFNVGTGANSTVFTTTLQPDGKIIIGGQFTSYSGSSINTIARLNTDGTLDTTFNVGTGTTSIVLTTTLQPDGKIIIGGSFGSYSGSSINRLARINTDGTLDTSFNVGTGANSTVRTTTFQPDGKIIIGGDFTSYSGSSINRLARINTDGTLDTTFNVGTGANGSVRTTPLQPDGKIIIGGAFTSYSGSNIVHLVRVNSNGSIDTSFRPDLDVNLLYGIPYALKVEDTGEILVGARPSYDNSFLGIGRFDSSGRLVVTAKNLKFGINLNTRTRSINLSSYPFLSTATSQPDGKIIIGGEFSSYSGSFINRLARINPDFSLDATFNIGNGFSADNTTADIRSIILEPNGKVAAVGSFYQYSGSFVKGITLLNSNGTIDTSFNVGAGVLEISNIFHSANKIARQEDGKFLICGRFTGFSGSTAFGITALNSSGSLNTQFNNGLGIDKTTLRIVQSLTEQPDGKIIIGGSFTSYSGSTSNFIARLNTDGTLDTTFNVGTGANNTVRTTPLQPDGKIIIGGQFTSYSGSSINRIARLNTNGTLDTTFNIGTGASSDIYTTTLQPDGKIIIGGNFTSYSGSSINRIARLNTDGTLDTTFNVGTGANNSVTTTTLQPDGKIIIGGGFTTYSGSSINRLARLNTDGTLDTSFNVGTGASSDIYTTTLQPDGKIIIGGFFTSYSGSSINRLARINTDGTLDTSFNVGTGANGIVLTTAVQPDGKIIIGGSFTTYSGSARNNIARLNTDGTLDTTFNASIGAGGYLYVLIVTAQQNVIVGGNFQAVNFENVKGFIRVNTNGTLDKSFVVGNGVNFTDGIRELFVVSGSKSIIAGSFTSYSGSSINRLARINTDGTLDTTFNVGTGANGDILSATLQPDEKIIIGGSFTSYSGSSINRIARINTDGTLDTTFNVGVGSGVNVNTIARQSDGKVIIGGNNRTEYSGSTSSGPIRINTDGTIDPTFKLPLYFSLNSLPTVYRILALPNNVYVGGSFILVEKESISNNVIVSKDGSLTEYKQPFLNTSKKNVIELKNIGTSTNDSDIIKFNSTLTVHTGSLTSQTTTKSGAYTDYTASYSVINGTPFLELTNVKPFDTINYEMDIVEMG